MGPLMTKWLLFNISRNIPSSCTKIRQNDKVLHRLVPPILKKCIQLLATCKNFLIVVLYDPWNWKLKASNKLLGDVAKKLQQQRSHQGEEEMGRAGHRRRPQRLDSRHLPCSRRPNGGCSRATPRHRRRCRDGGDHPRLQVLSLQLPPQPPPPLHR